ncbi:GerAB/ArcD/ProY family transporter [Pseudalkalibacillus berkeleyi]|uniref:Spore germination protein n=1 Tax=Pseudalkalibacillus berkeleyi TaxID=1069813 RepID=A0ABS9H0U4_9BACL|nr:GerAB/ArcD/ProY family transporter [Pseudalkalibacillus berkeleyi]MCF6138619.1 spore germination protein [Pseudalkalibacillus berkeleyi]
MNKLPHQHSVPTSSMVPPQMAFFLISSMIVGVGVLGFERYIVLDAGYDAWISVLLGGLWVHGLVWIMYKLLKDGGGDLVSIHHSLFGKVVGNMLSFIFSIYLLILCITVLRTFIELIQLWVFQQLNVWIFSTLFILIAYYFICGGFRTVTGICFISMIIGLPLLLLKFYPLQYSHVQNLYPVIQASIPDILKATRTMSLTYLGFEVLLIYYPFFKKPEESQRWAHYGLMFTILVYLGTVITSFIYYSEGQLKHLIWSTISLWKIVEFPFIARFEYFGIALYVFVILPNICLSLWASSRTLKLTLNLRQNRILIAYMVMIVVACGLMKDRTSVEWLNGIVGDTGFYFTSVYIPILFLIQRVVNKARNRK